MAKKTESTAARSAKKSPPVSKAASAPKSGQASKAVKPRTANEATSIKAKSEPAIAKSTLAKATTQKSVLAKVKAKPDAKTAAKAKPAIKSEIKTQAKPAAAKPRKTKTKTESVAPPTPAVDLSAAIDDPIGDLSDGEARHSTSDSKPEPESQAQMAAYRADTADQALDGTFEKAAEDPSSLLESEPAGSETHQSQHDDQPVKLDRLQKILSQAGIASRRHAEEMILAGRIMVNGQVITQLGAKADSARDHIKVDGKLIPAPERHRYFMLNKPRGFVTTVSDPEGRPTVMQFFAKMRERLYPVGRLDYESEGLLLVTNDGELANQLTRAASGVEKTYLVKVAGRPTAGELEQLRSGVLIERGEPGSDKTQTAPARISEFHTGARPGGAKSGRAGSQAGPENPWYEVVLIEGRNRELRKMFQSIGHFVEKIRRVGYGPLVLDVEPGQLRELTPQELTQLRRTAEGKSKPVEKSRRLENPRAPRPDAGRPPESREARRFDSRAAGKSGRPAPSRFGPARPFQSGERGEKQFRKFDPGRRPPFAGPKNQRPESRPEPRFEPRPDPRREERSSGPNRNFAGGPGQGFSRGPKPTFSAPRREFDRPAGTADNQGSGRAPNRFGAKRGEPRRDEPRRDEPRRSEPRRGEPRRGEPGRDEPRRGEFDRSGPDRMSPNQFGAKRPDAQRDASKPFGARPNFAARGDRGSRPRFDSGSRPNPASRPGFKPRFDRGPSTFRPRPNLEIRPAPRSEDSGFDSPREASNQRRPARPFSGPGRDSGAPRHSGPPRRGDFRSGPRPPSARFGANSGAHFDAPGENAPSRPAWKKSSPGFSPKFSPKSSHGSSPARGKGPDSRGGKPKRNPPRPGGRKPGGHKPGGPRPGRPKRG
jgi:23S rRNA pseudouridine2605 synthase